MEALRDPAVTVAQYMGDKHQLTFTATAPTRDEAHLTQSNNLLSASVAHHHEPPPSMVLTSPPTQAPPGQDIRTGELDKSLPDQHNHAAAITRRLWLRSALTQRGTGREGAPSPGYQRCYKNHPVLFGAKTPVYQQSQFSVFWINK